MVTTLWMTPLFLGTSTWSWVLQRSDFR